MELSEQLTAMTTERNQYKEMVDNLAAEVFSLDKSLVKAYQDNVSNGKDLYKLNKSITDLNSQIQNILSEKNQIQLDRDKYKNMFESMTANEEINAE